MSTFSFSMREGGLDEQEEDWLLHQEHASASFTGVGQTTERACPRD